MFLRLALFAILSITVAAPSLAYADPPSHAPAHGYRNKTKHHKSEKAEIVFDSERGVRVVVGMPGIFFEAGKYYRHVDGHWHVSARVDGGWSLVASGAIPGAIAKTRAHSGPAKIKHRK